MADARLDLIARAARNNAALCDAVCRSHGIAGRFDADAWVSADRTPPLYPDAVTLSPSVDRELLLDRVDGSDGCSVKDSFATLDLSAAPSWSVLFEATWIAASPRASASERARRSTDPDAPAVVWDEVTDGEELDRWAAAWRTDPATSDLWRPALLDEDVVVLAGRADGVVVAGAVVNVAAEVVGISNVFGGSDVIGGEGDGPGELVAEAWRACTSWVADHLPDRRLVGYESGDDLTAALDHGFEPIGPLRIWVRTCG